MLEPLAINNHTLEEFSKELKKRKYEFVAYDSVTNDVNELIARIGDADAIIIANNLLPEEVIKATPNLKFISVAFTGVDHIDIEACLGKNIKVSNSAGYSDQSVAELVIGMIISKLRNIVECNTAVREEKTKDGLVGSELSGKTVGIVGIGAIGLRIAELLKAFGCKLLGYDMVERGEGKKIGIKYVSLNELLETSDIITLHTPLNKETRFLINSNNIDLMKFNAILINCARGEVIEIDAVAQALSEEKIAGAAIDVFEIEPPLPSDHVLFSAKNTILTPHVAFATQESMIRRAKIAFDNVYAWLDGEQTNKII